MNFIRRIIRRNEIPNRAKRGPKNPDTGDGQGSGGDREKDRNKTKGNINP